MPTCGWCSRSTTAGSCASATSGSSGGCRARTLADDDPFDGVGPEPLDPRFTVREFRKRIRAPRPAQAPAGRPVVPRRRRQHLRRRGAVACAPPSAAVRALAATGRRRAAVSTHPRRPRRGGGATWLVDRRLHGARWGRVDAGAARRLPADRRALPTLRATHPPHRHRDPLHALLLVLSASAPRRARGGRGDPPHDDAPGSATSGRRGRRWTELAGEGSLGRTVDEERAARDRTERTRKAAAARRAAARAAAGDGPAGTG